jgi:hypothetical protein
VTFILIFRPYKKICRQIFLCGSGSGSALDPDSKFLLIRIRIEEKCWIRIRIESIRLHNPGSWDSVLTETIGVLYRPNICRTPGKSRVKSLWYNNRGTVDVKWRVLELSLLLHSTLQYRGLRNNHSANRSQVYYLPFCHCQAPLSGSKESMRTVLQACGNPLFNLDRWLWQSVVRPFYLCQSTGIVLQIATILVTHFIAEFGNRVKSIASAILHRQPPCSRHRIFLMRDFTSLPVRCGLFRPKLTTNGHSCHTISWYYPFKQSCWIVECITNR